MVCIVEVCFAFENEFGEFPKDMFVAIEESTGFVFSHTKMLLNIDVEIFEHLTTSVVHTLVDFYLHIGLKTVECRIDFFFGAALLVDFPNASFKIYSIGFAEDFIGSAEDVVEKIKLFVENVEYTHIGIVSQINKVYHYHIMFLPISVTTTYALLNTLWIPR